MSGLLVIVPFIFCFLISVLSVLFCEKMSKRFGFFDRPDGKLKVHNAPVPYLGGVAIFFVIGIALFCAFIILGIIKPLLTFLMIIVPFFLIGLVDDCFVFSPQMKFLLQFFAALFLLYLIGGLLLPLIKIFFLWLFILTIINAFNLVDVSDGLLSSICLPIFIFFWVFGIFFQLFFISFLAQILLGALLGFFIFNWAPARIYLGDAGSFFLASATLYLVFTTFFAMPGLFSKFTCLPILLLGVPLAELFGLISIRSYLGLPVYMGSPHHFSIYLKKQGLTSAQVAIFAGTASTVLALISASVLYLATPIMPVLFFTGFMFGLWCYLIYHPSQPIAKIIYFFRSHLNNANK